MSGQLDILALEPFYGGVRRAMLDSLIHSSRHRWTLLKLPPRRLERRLTAAAHWFAEQLSRHWVGHVDVLFTSEAMNLSDLRRLVPQLMHVPSVVYFHNNQLPAFDATGQTPTDLINLNSAAAANEIWFNSDFHLSQFLSRAGSLVRRHAELISRSPMSDLRAKAKVFPPPIDMTAVNALGVDVRTRNERTILIDLCSADLQLLNDMFAILEQRGETFDVIAVGKAGDLLPDHPVVLIDELDEVQTASAMKTSTVFLATCPSEFCNHHAIRALSAGCAPLLPRGSGYEELLPPSIHHAALYDHDSEALAERLQDIFHLDQLGGFMAQQRLLLRPFDPSIACKKMDARLSELAAATPAMTSR